MPGDSVVQYKQRDLTARERNRIIADLRRELRGAAREVRERGGRACNQYLLFTNVSLTIDEKNKLVAAIAEDSPDVRVQVFGAAEIAAMLNNLPYLRSAYFSTARFASWQKSWISHNRQALSGTVPRLVGRKDVLSATKAAVDDDAVRVVLISGGPDMGKTRLALNATQHRPFEAVVAIEGRTLTVADLLALRTPGQPLVIVIDDPDESTADALISAALAEELKLVMTVSSSDAANVASYWRDPRVKLLVLDPLSDSESRELLTAAGARLEYSVESWVIEQSGGNAGVLIGAASVGEQLRVEGANFFDQVGSQLENRARAGLARDAVDRLRLLSIMTAVGFSGPAAAELQVVCDTLGGLQPNDILADVRAMTRSGFLRLTGSYLEVVPPVLANYFAGIVIAGRARDIPALFLALPPLGRARLLRRLRQLRSDVVQNFWDKSRNHSRHTS
jgi:phosphoribosyl-AMP cyclohydrolase